MKTVTSAKGSALVTEDFGALIKEEERLEEPFHEKRSQEALGSQEANGGVLSNRASL